MSDSSTNRDEQPKTVVSREVLLLLAVFGIVGLALASML